MNFDKLRGHINFLQIIYWSKSLKICGSMVCYVLLCLILYLLINLPLDTHLRHNAMLITHLTKEFNDKQKLIRTEKALAQNAQITTEPNRLQPQPLSHLLAQLVTLASEAHLEFDTIKPLPQDSVRNLKIQPVQLSTTGHYQQLIDFLSNLARLTSISTLGDFSIKPLPIPLNNPTENILQLTLILNLYSKADPS